MGQQECDRIHRASLEILERVGIEVHDERARALLVKGGARADGVKVFVPDYLVHRALETASKRMLFGSRYW